LALLSPAYFKSEWCRKEWQEFCQQEQRRGEPRNRIFPLYLETEPEYDQEARRNPWQKDLARRQHLELRPWRGPPVDGVACHKDTLQQLVWDINERLVTLTWGVARRAGAPYQSLPLPAHYVRRPQEERRLIDDLLREDDKPGVVVTAVFGLGGIGKST